MPDYTQDARRLGVSTPLGKDALLLQGFEGQEPMSGLFSYGLQLLSENDNIDARSLIGQGVSFWLLRPDERPRHFHGRVNRFEYVGKGDRLSVYRANVVPWLWFADQNQDCRIFQHMTVPQIINEVFQSRGFTDFEDDFVQANYETLEYCVQYNESDFAFVSRLMESSGIFYFFRHENGRHVMVMADKTTACQPREDSKVSFQDKLSERTIYNEVWRWQHKYQFRPGKWAHKDFDFKSPNTDLLSKTKTLVDLKDNQAFEVYEYPSGYEARADGDSYAKIRMEAEEASFDVVNGQSSCRSFSPGARFTITKHHSDREKEKEYFVTVVRHKMDGSSAYTTGGAAATGGYQNAFTCVPADAPYRPERQTPVPKIHGTQTAVVVGPAGEEIYTDEFGRVKVQFHWDRQGQRDEHSSCWMRVSQVHAGQGWGMMDLPRIGEEVIVSFLEGDPDRPIIVGRVYNGQNMPPFSLPAGKTRRGNMTKTHKGAGYNEMSMDDTPGQQQLRMNAQHDMNSNVNNDKTETVGVNRTREVGNNESVKVGVDKSVEVGSNHKEAVGATQTIEVGADQSTTVGGSQTNSIAANQSNSIGSTQTNKIGLAMNEMVGAMSNEMVGFVKTVNVGVALNTLVGAMNMEETVGVKLILAGVNIRLQCGASSISMDAGGKIEIKGTNILIDSSGPTKINGGPIDLN